MNEQAQMIGKVTEWTCAQYDGDPPAPGEYKRPAFVVRGGDSCATVYTQYRADAKYRCKFSRALNDFAVDRLRCGDDPQQVADSYHCAVQIERVEYLEGE